MVAARRSFGINGLGPKYLQSRRITALSWDLVSRLSKNAAAKATKPARAGRISADLGITQPAGMGQGKQEADKTKVTKIPEMGGVQSSFKGRLSSTLSMRTGQNSCQK